MGYHLNRLDEPVFVLKPMLTVFVIHFEFGIIPTTILALIADLWGGETPLKN